jgi:hypothetical protein
MRSLPNVYWMPRVDKDIKRCLDFVARQPWGKPADRERDIHRGVDEIRHVPKRNAVEAYRPDSDVHLRRHNVAQFVIVYAYFDSEPEFPRGAISIRAVRHRRVRNVFHGVKESDAPPYGMDHRNSI